MNNEDYDIIDLLSETFLKSFKCMDSDLNDFLINDSKDYQKELLSKTYLIVNKLTGDIVAYFSLLNDVIKLDETEKKVRNRINGHIPYSKHRSHYSAVKLGHLAVDKRFTGQGIGKYIIDNLKFFFTHNNRTGCRFLTVDALASATGFYKHNGFQFFTETDKNDYTRLMYFDLKTFLST